MELNYKEIGERLKKSIGKIGGKEEFAKRYGCHPTTPLNWYSGANLPPIKNFNKIADAVERPVEYLFFGEEETKKNNISDELARSNSKLITLLSDHEEKIGKLENELTEIKLKLLSFIKLGGKRDIDRELGPFLGYGR